MPGRDVDAIVGLFFIKVISITTYCRTIVGDLSIYNNVAPSGLRLLAIVPATIMSPLGAGLVGALIVELLREETLS